jgi:hypothetical protein
MKRVFTSVFFIGEFLQKNRPEECDFDQYKGFLMGKMVQIHQIPKRKHSNCQISTTSSNR